MTLESPEAAPAGMEDELLVLRALCQDHGVGGIRSQATSLLSTYRFSNHTYQLVFEALRSLPLACPETLRFTLASRLTNLGFPDIELGPFFERQTIPNERILTIVRNLSTTRERESPSHTDPS